MTNHPDCLACPHKEGDAETVSFDNKNKALMRFVNLQAAGNSVAMCEHKDGNFSLCYRESQIKAA